MAAISFDKCWSYLAEIKEQNIDIANFINFQPTLANSVHDLSSLYRQIFRERDRLIKKKSSFSVKWFEKRMATLHNYQKAINQAIAIGKGIGDAFAWFFYQKNRSYLSEHLSQKEVFHSPPGLGGIGELEFAKNVRFVHGFFVLHHGTTNILRLGDISLIDLKSFSVAGIGEIKTSTGEPGEIEISILLSGPGIDFKKINVELMDAGVRKNKKPFMHGFPDDAKNRLKRQVKRINESFQVLQAEPDKKIRSESSYNFAALANVSNKSKCGAFNFEKISKSMIIGFYREKSKLLSTKLLKKSTINYNEKIIKVIDTVRGLMVAERSDNAIIVGSIYYDNNGKPKHLPGMLHFFWWPIDLKTLKGIFFLDSVAISIFNPSHLILSFELAGYKTQMSPNLNWEIYKEKHGKKIRLEGVNYYQKMIAEYLFTEEGILQAIEKFEESIDLDDSADSINIEIQINQEY